MVVPSQKRWFSESNTIANKTGQIFFLLLLLLFFWLLLTNLHYNLHLHSGRQFPTASELVQTASVGDVRGSGHLGHAVPCNMEAIN